MAKIIKRAGMIFFVSVISCLIALGCVMTMQVTDSSNNGIVNADTQNNIYTSQNNEDSSYTVPKAEVSEVPKADYEFNLTHKSDCNNTAECTCKQDLWNEANALSIATDKIVKVTLQEDWLAKNDANHSFGMGSAFATKGFIYVLSQAKIILDLNGFDIDKKFDSILADEYLPVIYVYGELSIMDSSYNRLEVQNVYNAYKDNQNNLVQNLKTLPFGRISGGATHGNGGAINTPSSAEYRPVINIYGGIISDNYAGTGGGINIYSNSTLNIFDGIVVDNHATVNGGGISSNGNINIYGGIIAANQCSVSGGGIYSYNNSKINLYSGTICQNTSKSGAGAGIYVLVSELNMYGGEVSYNHGNYAGIRLTGNHQNGIVTGWAYFNMYGGKICNNESTAFGGGLILHDASYGKIYDGEISYNSSLNDSGGVLVWNNSFLEMYGGKVHNNQVNYTAKNEHNVGGGVFVGERSDMIMYGGEVYENFIYSSINQPVRGGGIGLIGYSSLHLKGGIIRNNKAEDTSGAYGGGVFFDSISRLIMSGGSQIYGNTANSQSSNIYLLKDCVIEINDSLAYSDKATHVGVKLASDYGDNAFTFKYCVKNSGVAPNRYFYSDDKLVPIYENKEVKMQAATTDNPLPTITKTWSWDGVTNGNSNLMSAIVTYSGTPFVIKLQNQNFYKQGVAAGSDSFSVTDAGAYSFYTTENCTNPIFTFTILPAEVEIKWENSELVYNGGSQKPTAYIAEDPNCKVTVIGEQINSGGGYVATATGLSNKNYKINSSTMNKMFSISKAKLEKPKGSGTFEYDGSEKEYIPNGYNNATMNITGNKATAVGNYNATVSLKDKHNYMWNDGGVEDIILSYSVTLTPPIDEDNSEYKFIYIDNEDGKQVRKTYKQGGLVHGINDGEVNGGKLVLGNVKPNTSVKSFIQTLGFEQSKITIKDSKGKDIFKDGNPVDASKFDNGKELAVGTGWSVEYQNNGNTETIYISVLGDVNGDGRISASDCAYLRQIASDNALYESLSVEKKLASMVINKGNVTSADAEIVKNVINKMFGIDIFF